MRDKAATDWQSIIDALAEHRTSKAPAVVDRGHVVTHAELWRKARVLAGLLQKHGVGRERLVVIAVPKSYQYIESVLAVWMAGGAYLPVDATMPDSRLRDIMEQAAAHNRATGLDSLPLLALPGDRERLEALCRDAAYINFNASPSDATPSAPSPSDIANTPDADSDDSTIASDNFTTTTANLAPEDLAYVIFTSGSTGKPKGVMIEHRGLVGMLREQIAAFELDQNTRSLFYLSTSFDASISDFGTALLAGGTLYITEPDELTPGAPLIGTLTRYGITYIDIPPAALRLLDSGKLPQTLKSMVIGGEVCPQDVVRDFAGKLRLVCVYGPTEATVCTSWTHCLPDAWQDAYIGRPIKGISYRLSDDGELLIAGDGLARGYLHRPDLDKDRFILLDGERYYRTGDQVERAKDGNYIFVGRIDRQMKLRGMLIEPGEIEVALAEHAQIARAAVLKRNLPNGREILVAYLVGKERENNPDRSAVRDHLSQKIPRWMLPHRYQWLPEMPTTVTGKIDARALGELPLATLDAATRPSLDTDANATDALKSQSANGRKIEIALQDLLGYDHLLPDDNLFDLGLDSLAVIELAAALSLQGLELSPHAIYTNPTIRGLESALEQTTPISDFLTADSLRKHIDELPLFQELLSLATTLSKDKTESASDLTTHNSRKPTKPAHILMSGAAGYTGSRLLERLLHDRELRITAIVRAKDDDSAAQRLLAACSTSTVGDALASGRLQARAGDIGAHKLGLHDYDALAQSVDTVLHVAARVNMVQSFAALARDNLLGTLHMAAFALAGKRKTLHHISTLSVFVATEHTGLCNESDLLENTQRIYGGYGQSKWAAESALIKLAQHGLPLAIYRLGLITGDTITGAMSDNDFLSMFIRGLVSAGSLPLEAFSADGARLKVDITPVDHATAVMTRLMENGQVISENNPRVYHIASEKPLTLAALVGHLQTSCGLEAVPLAEIESANASNEALAAAYLSLCRLTAQDAATFEKQRVMDLFQTTDVTFDMSNTKAALAALDRTYECPEADERLLSIYTSHALKSQ